MQRLVTYTDFISKLTKIFPVGIIYIPTATGTYKKVNSVEELKNISLSSIRMIEPIKSFVFKFKEELIDSKETTKIYVIGVKSCDLQALKVLDNIFLKDYVDTFYKTWREKIFVISTDCPEPKDTCFCKLINLKPYPTNLFDINVSFIDENNFILEPGSEQGEKFLSENFLDCDQPSQNDLNKRNNLRSLSERKVLNFNKDFIKNNDDEYYKVVKNTYEANNVWKKESETCVQCAGCNFICPSCYCFLIREGSKSYTDQYRDKVWDACHFTGYSRVAGGANPRKYKFERFRNRYQCKFVYRKENYGFYACTGCGRCIEVCPGRIDIRKVVRSLLVAKGEEVLV